MKETEFPQGSGDPKCPDCRGRGAITVMIDMGGVPWPGATKPCMCVYKQDLLANIRRIWPVLLKAHPIEESPLLDLTSKDAWITASSKSLREHLRHVAFRKGPYWDARVTTDSALVTAWLSNADGVFDADVLTSKPSKDYTTIVDIAIANKLLIIRLGVKAAKNRETPNVLAETLYEREQRGLLTWIVDSPTKPFNSNHIAFSEDLYEYLRSFARVEINTASEYDFEVFGGTNPTSTAQKTTPNTPYYLRMNPGQRASLEQNAQEPPKQAPRRRFEHADDLDPSNIIEDAFEPQPPPSVEIVPVRGDLPDEAAQFLERKRTRQTPLTGVSRYTRKITKRGDE